MELTGRRSVNCKRHTTLGYLLISCCLPILTFAMPFTSCDRLQFEYQLSGNSSLSLYLCIDVCPPTKTSPNNRQFCCLNCPEYCTRCLNVSSTNPPEMRESVTSSFQQYPSPTSVELSTRGTSPLSATNQLPLEEVNRQEKAEWKMKEIVYIAIISCLVFVLVAAIAAFLVRNKFIFPSLRESTSMNSSQGPDTASEQHGLLSNQQLDRQMPVEHDVKHSSLCALQQNDSLDTQENREINPSDNTPLKEIETPSHDRSPLMSSPHSLHEDSWKHSIKVTEWTSCSELQALQ